MPWGLPVWPLYMSQQVQIPNNKPTHCFLIDTSPISCASSSRTWAPQVWGWQTPTLLSPLSWSQSAPTRMLAKSLQNPSCHRLCHGSTNQPLPRSGLRGRGLSCLIRFGLAHRCFTSLASSCLHTSPRIVPVHCIVVSHVSRASEWPLSCYHVIILLLLSTAS